MGTLLTVLPPTVNRTELGSQELCDDLFLRYRIDLPDLPPHCYVCDTTFPIYHVLDFKKGGLIITCHNNLRDGVANLSGKAFTPSHVRHDPLIHPGRTVW